jgi:cell wall-associated NlpC family hydrolase
MQPNYTDYIGIPFNYNGRTRNELDCYGLVMLLYRDLKGIKVPDVISPIYLKEMAATVSNEALKWTPCEREEGAVLVFNIKGYGAHVGYMIGPDRMIHTWEKTNGVTIERLSTGWDRRIIGCYKYEDRSNQDN